MWQMSIKLNDGINHPLTKNHAKWLLNHRLTERSFMKACECKYAHSVGRNGKGSRLVHQQKEKRRKINERNYGKTAQWLRLKPFSTTGKW